MRQGYLTGAAAMVWTAPDPKQPVALVYVFGLYTLVRIQFANAMSGRHFESKQRLRATNVMPWKMSVDRILPRFVFCPLSARTDKLAVMVTLDQSLAYRCMV